MQSMFFSSDRIVFQWDTWIYFHDEVYYLYYLAKDKSKYGYWNCFGVATSTDGVEWKDYGITLAASDKMVNFLGTGSVWKSVDFDKTGLFICNYSERRNDESGKPAQNICFAWSKDLIHWTKYDDEKIFNVDTRWYEKYGRWDCIFPVAREGGGYYGTWTATPAGGTYETGGIGFGYSNDGLHWEAVKPPEIIPDAYESGAICRIGKKYYCMFGEHREGWQFVMNTYTADSIEGPYKKSTRNTILLAPGNTYFSRFFETPEGVFVNHHAISRFPDKDNLMITYFAPIKKVRIEQDGSLWLVYWKGNDKLKKIPVEMKYNNTVNKNGINIRIPENSLNANDGCVIEGIMNLQKNPGIYFECMGDKSACMSVSENAEISFYLTAETGNTPDISFLPEKFKVQRDRQFGKTVQFRVLLKKHVMEIYFDDIYMSSYSLPGDSTGKAGLTGTENSVTAIKSWNVY